MTKQDAIAHGRLEFDVVLDAWPDNTQGQALHSLITSGDVIAVQLPHGFVGLIIVPAPMLLHPGRGATSHQAKVLPTPGGRVRWYERTGTRSDRQEDSRF
jgi:hypothetical protein